MAGSQLRVPGVGCAGQGVAVGDAVSMVPALGFALGGTFGDAIGVSVAGDVCILDPLCARRRHVLFPFNRPTGCSLHPHTRLKSCI